jgi:hypothetical protein
VAQDVKVTIICPLHGEFEQYPANHYNKKTNCPKCSTESTISKQRSNTTEFAKKASRVHNGFYSYTNVDYKTAKKVYILLALYTETSPSYQLTT